MVICLAASLVLAVTYKITSPAIEMQSIAQEKEALKEILPQADEFVQKQEGRFSYYECLKNKNIIGYVLKTKAAGYGGDINLLAGIDAQGVIQAIEVLSHQETPGLGSRITEIKQGDKAPWFLEQFKGKLAPGLKLSDIQTISGATISSKAVLGSIKKDAEEFLALKKG